MARRFVRMVTGEVYHVFNRGVDKRRVFDDTQDYLRMYQSLRLFNTCEPVVNFMFARSHVKIVQDPLVSIHAYSLLPNHLHFLIEQKVDGGISEYMKRVFGGYTSYYNERNKRTGALFQGTFKRVHVDSDALYNYLFAYVNENHIVHGISRPNEILYSSSLHHQGKAKSALIKMPTLGNYNFQANVELAKEIFAKRAFEKKNLHEDE